eukprot:3372409-Pyramimonas_sp.AAC.1
MYPPRWSGPIRRRKRGYILTTDQSGGLTERARTGAAEHADVLAGVDGASDGGTAPRGDELPAPHVRPARE